MNRIGVLTSGGDAPGMNAAIRAAVRNGIASGMKVFGIERGYEGLIDGDIYEMDVKSVADIIHRGGTMLQTARSERFMTKEGLDKAVMMAQSFGLDSLVIIGGNGSLTGALTLAERGIHVECLPGTIDNDLGYTDRTIGFDTAVNTVLGAVSNIRDTSSSHERTTIIEVMGRHCGDIALYTGLAGGAESVLVPEIPFDINAICVKIIQGRNRGKKHNIIIKAEGVEIDSFELAKTIQERTGVESKVVVLGYLQRGGSPTAEDRLFASRAGFKAVELIKDGIYDRAIGLAGNELVHYPLADALKIPTKAATEYLDIIDVLS
ncbi:MAG: 6-phosphofructokinase [Firmicutes bacterium]|nr:6-phosphofructokinase [Bacillota bacterium]MBQ4371467.1 6-phosphofructokinase [Bacillota bacterium]